VAALLIRIRRRLEGLQQPFQTLSEAFGPAKPGAIDSFLCFCNSNRSKNLFYACDAVSCASFLPSPKGAATAPEQSRSSTKAHPGRAIFVFFASFDRNYRSEMVSAEAAFKPVRR
jgi:hypothetical protein